MFLYKKLESYIIKENTIKDNHPQELIYKEIFK